MDGKERKIDEKTEKYPNCTMPWHQSMLGKQSYNESDIKPCNGNDAYILYRLDYEFLQSGAKLRIPNCLGRYILSKFLEVGTNVFID